jgi:hypothetical protein
MGWYSPNTKEILPLEVELLHPVTQKVGQFLTIHPLGH